MSALEELLDLLRSATDENDKQGKRIIVYLERKINAINVSFTSSAAFQSQVRSAINSITQHPQQKFKFISEIITVLKSHKGKKGEPNGKIYQNNDSKIDEPNQQAKKLAAIKRMECLMEAYSKEIKKMEEKELSIDELEKDDSIYLTMERLKQRCIKIHRRICQIGGYDHNADGGLRSRKVRYDGSRYKELNYHVTKLINRSENSEERMPDYHDVLKIVRKCNGKYNYSLSDSRIKDLAKEVFSKIGCDLQNLRKNDFQNDFGHTDAVNALLRSNTGFEDPALTDAGLRNKLTENRKRGDENLRNIFNHYSREQEDRVQAAAGPSGPAQGGIERSDDSDGGSESEDDIDGSEDGVEDGLDIEIIEDDVLPQAATAEDDSNSQPSPTSSQSSNAEELDMELSDLDEASSDSEDEGESHPMEHEDPPVCTAPKPEVIELSDSDD